MIADTAAWASEVPVQEITAAIDHLTLSPRTGTVYWWRVEKRSNRLLTKPLLPHDGRVGEMAAGCAQLSLIWSSSGAGVSAGAGAPLTPASSVPSASVAASFKVATSQPSSEVQESSAAARHRCRYC